MSTGKPAARVGDQDTGHGIFGPTPITTGAGSVTIGGKPAARVGDMLAPHHPGARVIMKGSASVTIEGRPAARLGDPINCGGFIAIGEGSVCIGDAPAQLDPAPLSAAFSAYVKALLDPKTKVYSPDELKTLQDSIAVKYEPRFPGDTVGQLKAQYAQQEAAAPLVSESVNHQRTYTTSSTVTPTATPPQAAVDIRVVEADGLPAAGLPYLMTADDGTQRTGTLDALGQAHEPQLPAGQVTVTVGDPTNSTEIRHTRAGLREELARILQAERAEAAQLAAELTEKSAVGVYWAYRKAELRGLWNGTAGLISSLKELSDLALPLAHFQRAAKAAWQAWKHTDESPYLQAFHKNFTDAQFKELADVLGIDPRSITKAQLAEISTLINFLWDDEQTRSILLKFAGQYIEAQHSIEVVETLYATVPEVAFDILITALTLGSGATVVIATKARWIDRLSGVGRLLKQLAQQLKKAKGQQSRVGYTGDRVDIEVERPEYQELELRAGMVHIGAAWDPPINTRWNPSAKSENCIACVASYTTDRLDGRAGPFLTADDVERIYASVDPSRGLQLSEAIDIIRRAAKSEVAPTVRSPFSPDAPVGQYSLFFGPSKQKLRHVVHAEVLPDGSGIKMFDPQNGQRISIDDLMSLRIKWGGHKDSPVVPVLIRGH